MPYCPSLPNPTTTRGPRYLYLQKNFGFKCNFMHAYAADRLVENPCVKLAFCIELRVPLCSIIQKVHRKSRVFWQHRICSSCNIRFHKTTTHPIMMNFNLESCKLHHSFAKTTIFGVDVYMHHFFYSLFSHNIHTMERFAMKSRIP